MTHGRFCAHRPPALQGRVVFGKHRRQEMEPETSVTVLLGRRTLKAKEHIMLNYRMRAAQLLGVGAMAAALAILPLGASFAAPGGGGGGHAGGGSMGGGPVGGQSSGRISTQGMSNTNGPNAVDRDLGQARANDRTGVVRGTNGTHGADRNVAARRADFRGNGIHARDRDFGRARAADRRNFRGGSHQFTTRHHRGRRHHG